MKRFFHYNLTTYALITAIIIWFHLFSPQNVLAVEPICPGGSNPDPKVLFCDDFEQGDLSKWDQACSKCTTTTTPDPVYSGTYSLKIPYCLNYGGTGLGLSCATSTYDQNRYVGKDMTSYNLTHFFIRGHFRLVSGATQAEQKKLFYIFGANPSLGQWDVMLIAWDLSPSDPLHLVIEENAYSWADLRYKTKLGYINYDQWYSLEVEVRLNTVSPSVIKDGEVRVWLDGNKIFDKRNIQIRNANTPLGNVFVGDQVNDINGPYPLQETRYWDNVVISNGYIGPLGWSPPMPPSNLVVK